MRIRHVICTLSILFTSTYAQKPLKIQANYTCHYYGKKVNEKAICNMFNSFVSRKEAENAVDQIVKRSGLKKNFYVMECQGIDNCFAATQNGVRLIVYDPNFMNKVNSQTKTDWGSMSILAHEVGHHLQGHTIDGEASTPAKELEADYFSGFVMYQLGASLKDAQAAINKFQDDYGSSSHPPRKQRLSSIEKGYASAKELFPAINTQTKSAEIENKSGAPRTEVIVEEVRPDIIKDNGIVVYETRKPKTSTKTGCIEGSCTNGYGIAVNKNTHERYEGEWQSGKRHGNGLEYLPNGKLKYEGEYTAGKWHGNGVLYYPNGDIYVGNFVNARITDPRLDYSFYQYQNGDRYVGQFRNGKKHGKGMIYYADGTKEKVTYEFGTKLN